MSNLTVKPREPRVLRVELSLKTVAAIVLTVGCIWVLGQLWAILTVVAAALMLAGALNPVIVCMGRRGLRRPWALALLFLLSTVALGVLAVVTVPALWAEVERIFESLPALQERAARFFEAHRNLASYAGTIRNYHLGLTAAVPGAFATVAALSLTVVEVVGYGTTTAVLGLYFIADQERMRGALFALVPRRFHLRLARVLLNLGVIVGGYIRGQLITSVAISVFAFALLTLLRVPNSLALAAFAGLTDVLPFVGGFLATAPAVLAALPRGPAVAGIVLASMLAYQSFESRVLVPRIYGTTLRLPSVAVVVALLIGGKLGGVVGALLALPVAAGLLMLVEELRLELPGDDSDDPELRARDARAERLYARRSAGASAEDAAKVAGKLASAIQEEDAKLHRPPEEVALTDGQPKP